MKVDESVRQRSLLDSYRVLDLADDKGLLCGKILGDLGADVIKVEKPGGDAARNIGPFYNDIPSPEKSLFWFFTNLNKRGITLDIENPDGKEIFKRLVRTADFVIESFEPGYMESLGLGYEELEKINPRIIMTSITPFGQSGPYAHYKATDLVGEAMGGLVRMFGELDRPPNRIGAPQVYFMGGLHGFTGSMLAHYHRELSGEGQHVDISCQQAVAMATPPVIVVQDIMGFSFRGLGSSTMYPRAAPHEMLMLRLHYRCKDGYVFAPLLGGGQAGMVKSTRTVVEKANREGMLLELKDYDWTKHDTSTIPKERFDRLQELWQEYLLTKTKAELLKWAAAAEVLILPVSDAKDTVESPQLTAREFWAKVEHSELGQAITYPGWPIKMSELPRYQPQRRAPLIGEHNEEIYKDELGLSKEQLILLKARGII